MEAQLGMDVDLINCGGGRPDPVIMGSMWRWYTQPFARGAVVRENYASTESSSISFTQVTGSEASDRWHFLWNKVLWGIVQLDGIGDTEHPKGRLAICAPEVSPRQEGVHKDIAAFVKVLEVRAPNPGN